jgi:mono/diheme cytochrome c family protein
MNKSNAWMAAALVLASAGGAAQAGSSPATSADDLARGRYMVLTGHCNNCHTAGYTGKQGDVPEQEWLLGNPVGFRSDLGTAYASNLRLTVRSFTQEQWVTYAKGAKPRPPMPWWSVHETSESDLRAMYKFIISLGAAGQTVPAFVPADREPLPPYEVRRLVR